MHLCVYFSYIVLHLTYFTHQNLFKIYLCCYITSLFPLLLSSISLLDYIRFSLNEHLNEMNKADINILIQHVLIRICFYFS